MSKTAGWCLVRVGLLHLSTVEDVTWQHTWKVRWGYARKWTEREREPFMILLWLHQHTYLLLTESEHLWSNTKKPYQLTNFFFEKWTFCRGGSSFRIKIISPSLWQLLGFTSSPRWALSQVLSLVPAWTCLWEWSLGDFTTSYGSLVPNIVPVVVKCDHEFSKRHSVKSEVESETVLSWILRRPFSCSTVPDVVYSEQCLLKTLRVREPAVIRTLPLAENVYKVGKRGKSIFQNHSGVVKGMGQQGQNLKKYPQ